MKTIAIIPARYASTRFPGKPLAYIGGSPMLRHVYERVSASGLFDMVVIATDDSRILGVAESWDANVIMTSEEHESGTERCAEVISKLEAQFDIVVNVQGDEPFISMEPLKQLVSLFENKDVEIGTLVQKIEDERDIENPNVVKAVLGINKQALYFSRSPIPYVRDKSHTETVFMKHIGIYGYRTSVLQKIVKLAPGALEKAESLEQLRWLENGYRIFAEETAYRMLAVDTPEDLIKAEEFFNSIK